MSLFPDHDATTAIMRSRISGLPYFAGTTISNEDLYAYVIASEAEIARRLKVFLVPTDVFALPIAPGEEPTSGAWFEEPAYDYDPENFRGDRWGFFVLRQTPVIHIEKLEFAYPSPGVGTWQIPADWIHVDKKYGYVQLVPSSAAFSAPFGAWLMQAMGAGRVIPHMMRIKYVAGLKNAAQDYPDLIDLIYKAAVLRIIESAFVPGSESISADGLSQSSSVDISKFNDEIDRKLFGPPRTNGGLYTAIHGLPMTFIG